VIGWDRGRPARNEREARKPIGGYLPKDCALSACFRAERPRFQQSLDWFLPLSQTDPHFHIWTSFLHHC